MERVRPSQLLTDMRVVFGQSKEKDRTEAHRVLRELLEKDPGEYHRRLQAMESEFLRFGRGKRGVVVTEPSEVSVVGETPVEEEVIKDAGSERAEDLINQLLDEWEGRKK